MKRSRWQPFLSTDDMRDFHQMVIDDVGEVVGRQVVCRFVEHFIIEDIGVDDHFPANQIVHMHILIGFYFEPYHVFLALIEQSLYFLCRHGEGVTHAHARAGIVLEIRNLRALGLEFFGRIKGNIGMSGIQELFDILMVDLATLRLTVGTVRADSLDLFGAFLLTQTFVDADTEPIEGFEDIFFCSGHETCAIRILDTKQHVTPVLTGKQIIVQSGTNSADV